MADDFAITVDQVSKRFRLYNERAGSLKEMITKRQGARYNDFWAVDDVSLEVEHGSVYGLVRPQRLGQVHHAQDDGRHPQAHQRHGHDGRSHLRAARAGRRLPPRPERA